MLFGLPPIFGLLPLLFLVVISFNSKIHPTARVAYAVLFAALLTQEPLYKLGSQIGAGLGTTMGLIGFIVMLGTGLANLLKETGVAEVIVRFISQKIGIRTQSRAILATMVSGTLLVSVLGTLAGSNAIIAPIVIPLVAAVGITPSVVAVLFQGASQCGLFLGPFSPSAVVLMDITKLTYPEYFLTIAFPIALVMQIATFLVAKKVQKITQGIESYGAEDLISSEDFKPSKKAVRATIAFVVTMIALISIGISVQGGAAFSIVIITTVGIVTGLVAGLDSYKITELLLSGGRMLWLAAGLILTSPLLAMITATGAFAALSTYVQPYITVAGKPLFILLTCLIGIFGINGAHVAQSYIIHELFGPMAYALGCSIPLWGMCIQVGTQITSFAYPAADMFGAMGMAKGKEIKHMMRLAYTGIIPATVALTFMASFIL